MDYLYIKSEGTKFAHSKDIKKTQNVIIEGNFGSIWSIKVNSNNTV